MNLWKSPGGESIKGAECTTKIGGDFSFCAHTSGGNQMHRTDNHQKGMFDIQAQCIDGSMPNGKWTVRVGGSIPSTKGTTQPESDGTKSVLRSLRRGFGVNYSSTISWVLGFWERKNLKLCACIRLTRQAQPSSLKKNWDSLQWVEEYGAVFWVLLPF